MKKIALVNDKPFLNNQMFNKDSYLNFDDLLYPGRLLKQKLSELNYDLATYDINGINESDFVFYFDVNNDTPLPSTLDQINKAILFIFECQIIAPHLYDKELHKKFVKIFTFRDDLVDNKKYFKLNYTYNIPKKINKDISLKKKLCVLIAGNKRSRNILELYSKRIEAIRWFEKYALDDFDLYGRGWQNYVPNSYFLRQIINRVKPWQYLINKIFLLLTPYRSYKGELDHKCVHMQSYKFSICYENAQDIPGYITEKIFHCFFAGVIPIYWGASNITDYVPKECFIDKRDFSSYEDLYEYIKVMPDKVYVNYLNQIEAYLNSEKAACFHADYFISSVIKLIFKK